MDLGLDGKNILVTAASEGIGFAAAGMLAQQGANIILSSRSEKNLLEAKEKIGNDRVTAVFCADMCSADDVNGLVQSVLDEVGRIDVLVHNTGGPVTGELFKLKDAEWNQAFLMMVDNYRRLVMGLVPKMKENNWGRIISIGSTSIRQPISDLLLSNTFRPALAGLNKSLSDKYGSDGITFNTICPGGILTNRVNRVLGVRAEEHGTSIEQQKNAYISNIPMRRFGDPEDVAHAVSFLASECANFITGTCLSVDGGLSRTIF